ncbi:MAG: hypothetical protein FJ118_08485 [Deltaproteobacteria bacterium]|nr:hypothetical protein [Deltaproteobacteria bacterium]
MLRRILSSSLFALVALSLAAVSLVLLYLKGRTDAAMIGAILLAVATLLVFFGGRRKSSPEDDTMDY